MTSHVHLIMYLCNVIKLHHVSVFKLVTLLNDYIVAMFSDLSQPDSLT